MVTRQEFRDKNRDIVLKKREDRVKHREEMRQQRYKNIAARRENRKRFWKEGRLGKGLKYGLDKVSDFAKGTVKETGRVATHKNTASNIKAIGSLKSSK